MKTINFYHGCQILNHFQEMEILSSVREPKLHSRGIKYLRQIWHPDGKVPF